MHIRDVVRRLLGLPDAAEKEPETTGRIETVKPNLRWLEDAPPEKTDAAPSAPPSDPHAQ